MVVDIAPDKDLVLNDYGTYLDGDHFCGEMGGGWFLHVYDDGKGCQAWVSTTSDPYDDSNEKGYGWGDDAQEAVFDLIDNIDFWPAYAKRATSGEWRHDANAYYEIFGKLSTTEWTYIDGAYLIIVDDDVVEVADWGHGWESSSYDEGYDTTLGLFGSNPVAFDTPQEAVDWANDNINWIGDYRLPAIILCH